MGDGVGDIISEPRDNILKTRHKKYILWRSGWA